MTWFAHVCWFCKRKSRRVNYLISDQPYKYQCKDRRRCELRREALRLREAGGVVTLPAAQASIEMNGGITEP